MVFTTLFWRAYQAHSCFLTYFCREYQVHSWVLRLCFVGRIKREIEGEVHYAGSDSLLSEKDYEAHPELQMFPTMAG